MARPTKPFFADWLNEHITGLCRLPDGRWRMVATGKRFREPDPRKAVERFLAMTRPDPNAGLVRVARPVASVGPDREPRVDPKALVESALASDRLGRQKGIYLNIQTTEGGADCGIWVPEQLLWGWFSEQLRTNRALVAQKVNCPAIALLQDDQLPPNPVPLDHILTLYATKADVLPGSKRDTVKSFEDFMSLTGARTLGELTTDRLAAYRDAIRARVKSPGTIQSYFGRVKWVVRFAKSEGVDPIQVDAALSRMTLLKAPRDRRVLAPSPMLREDFHAILAAADRVAPTWRPRLLVMLNCCQHMDETLDVRWDDFDLKQGTFCTRRNKRGRVIRAATLWPQTLAALGDVRRTASPYVFVSTHGSRFNARGQWKTWNKIRTEAKLPNAKTDDIRDGAFTAACNAPGVDEKFARLLAGHRSHGLQDNYVMRNPAVVRPACDAVYAAYFGEPPNRV